MSLSEVVVASQRGFARSAASIKYLNAFARAEATADPRKAHAEARLQSL
jgi:hypothetical protein